MPPTVSWDETSPAGNTDASLGDDRIREVKTQIREVIDVDHDFPSSGSAADVGQHKQVTLQEQADLGTGAAGATILGSQTVSGKGELVYTDEDDNDIQITDNGSINAEAISGVYPAADVAAIANIMDLVYPIGSVYTNYSDSTNPGTLLGVGTWVAIEGRVVVGLDAGDADFDTGGETGGSKTVDLSHTHVLTAGASVGGGAAYATSTDSKLSATQSIVQPYVVCYVWRRSA